MKGRLIVISLNDECKELYRNACRRGKYERNVSPLEIHSLIHVELSEASRSVLDGVDFDVN